MITIIEYFGINLIDSLFLLLYFFIKIFIISIIEIVPYGNYSFITLEILWYSSGYVIPRKYDISQAPPLYILIISALSKKSALKTTYLKVKDVGESFPAWWSFGWKMQYRVTTRVLISSFLSYTSYILTTSSMTVVCIQVIFIL